MQYSIRSIQSFEAVFKKLARKAVKLGLQQPSFKVIGERTETAKIYEIVEGETRSTGETEEVIVHDIEITGLEPVRLDGWNFVATIESVQDKENLIYAFPGIEVPQRFATSGCICEHCNIRRARINTYVVRHSETNEYKQVGKTCLQDFIGHQSAEGLARQFEFWGEITRDLDALYRGEQEGWEGGKNRAHSLRTIAAKALAYSEEKGWVSGSKAYEGGGTSTADIVRRQGKDIKETDEHYAKIEIAVSYFASLPQEQRSQPGLNNNLAIICNAGYCSDKSFGLGCALWACYKGALARQEAIENDERRRLNSKHFGTQGERIKDIKAKVIRIYGYEGDYGYVTKTIVETSDGNVAVAGALYDKVNQIEAEEGDEVTFTATVKEHGEFRGTKQTKLLRAGKITIKAKEEAAA